MFAQHPNPTKIAGITDVGRGNNTGERDRFCLVKSEPPVSLIEFRDGTSVKEGQPMEFGHRVCNLIVMSDDTLDSMNEFERTVIAALQRLCGLAQPRSRMAFAAETRAAGVASLLRMMPTSTLMAVLVWLRAIDLISVSVLAT